MLETSSKSLARALPLFKAKWPAKTPAVYTFERVEEHKLRGKKKVRNQNGEDFVCVILILFS